MGQGFYEQINQIWFLKKVDTDIWNFGKEIFGTH